MPLSDKRKASNKKSEEKYKHISLKIRRETGEADAIRAAAAAAGQSVQAYILYAVRDQMHRDAATRADD